MRLILLAASALSLAACALPYTPPALPPVTQPAPASTGVALPAAPAAVPVTATATAATTPVTILVSIDGFRPDYLRRGSTPNLDRLAAGGVSAAMWPSFPTKTFPNHWAIVTGEVPDRNGIVGNTMEDPGHPGETFTVASDAPFWWSEAEPIWVTAERAGIPTATMFWPGSNVGWGGTPSALGHGLIDHAIRPRDWQAFNQAVTERQRTDAVIDWLRRPLATRPRLVTLYFDTVDVVSHDTGPGSPATMQAAATIDAQIGRLVAELAAMRVTANLVIVSDHGMAATDTARSIALDTIARPGDFRVIESGPYAAIYPVPGREAALEAALLRPHAHMTCWRKADIPARFQYGRNPRVAPYLCLAEDGWLILKTTPTRPDTGGAHGYDNKAPDMAALFIANGPRFAAGKRIGSFPNTDVNPLLRDLLGLPAGRGLDGSDAPFRQVLQR